RHSDGAGMIRIAVVDDHPVVREGLVAALEREFAIVLAAGDADALLRSSAEVDVILLDLDLGGTSVLPLLPRLRERGRVLILSAYGNDEQVVEAVRAGA